MRATHIRLVDIFRWKTLIGRRRDDGHPVVVTFDFGELEYGEEQDAINCFQTLKWPKYVKTLQILDVDHYITRKSNRLLSALLSVIISGPPELEIVRWHFSKTKELFEALEIKSKSKRSIWSSLKSLRLKSNIAGISTRDGTASLASLLSCDGVGESPRPTTLTKLEVIFGLPVDTSVGWELLARAIGNSTTLVDLRLTGEVPWTMIPNSLPATLEKFVISLRYLSPTFPWLLHESSWPAGLRVLEVYDANVGPTAPLVADSSAELVRHRLSQLKDLAWHVKGDHERIIDVLSRENQLHILEVHAETPRASVERMLQSRYCLVESFTHSIQNARCFQWMIVGKTRIRSSHSNNIFQTTFELALGSKWFQVMQVLLSIRSVPRLLQPAAAPSLAAVPWPDHLPRIAEVMGWPLRDLFV
jgi:hypothetical protein